MKAWVATCIDTARVASGFLPWKRNHQIGINENKETQYLQLGREASLYRMYATLR
jgi:hypothetical protein